MGCIAIYTGLDRALFTAGVSSDGDDKMTTGAPSVGTVGFSDFATKGGRSHRGRRRRDVRHYGLYGTCGRRAIPRIGLHRKRAGRLRLDGRGWRTGESLGRNGRRRHIRSRCRSDGASRQWQRNNWILLPLGDDIRRLTRATDTLSCGK